MHNGFLNVEGEKMSKSLGNFVTINELLYERKFGSNMWHGKVLRFAMLETHYRQPMDWTVDRLVRAREILWRWTDLREFPIEDALFPEFEAAISDDLNVPAAYAILHRLDKSGTEIDKIRLKTALHFLGLYDNEKPEEINVGYQVRDVGEDRYIQSRVDDRNNARARKDFKESDRIRDELLAKGIVLKDNKDGTTSWEVKR
jgi:cysteinyl-tRNA synthetase